MVWNITQYWYICPLIWPLWLRHTDTVDITEMKQLNIATLDTKKNLWSLPITMRGFKPWLVVITTRFHNFIVLVLVIGLIVSNFWLSEFKFVSSFYLNLQLKLFLKFQLCCFKKKWEAILQFESPMMVYRVCGDGQVTIY